MSLTISSGFIFYLCICSLHACHARHLGLTGDHGGLGKQLLFPSKEVGKVEIVNMDSARKEAEAADSIGYKSHGGKMIPEKPKGMKFSAEEEEEAAAISGNIIEESSSHMGLAKAIGIKKPRWQSSGRVILEHDPQGTQQQQQQQQQEGTPSTSHNSVNEEVPQDDYEPAR